MHGAPQARRALHTPGGGQTLGRGSCAGRLRHWPGSPAEAADSLCTASSSHRATRSGRWLRAVMAPACSAAEPPAALVRRQTCLQRRGSRRGAGKRALLCRAARARPRRRQANCGSDCRIAAALQCRFNDLHLQCVGKQKHTFKQPNITLCLPKPAAPRRLPGHLTPAARRPRGRSPAAGTRAAPPRPRATAPRPAPCARTGGAARATARCGCRAGCRRAPGEAVRGSGQRCARVQASRGATPCRHHLHPSPPPRRKQAIHTH